MAKFNDPVLLAGDPSDPLQAATKQYVDAATYDYPERYGAVGDGVTDDSAAINAMLQASRVCKLTPGKTYGLGNYLRVPSNTILIAYGATLLRVSTNSLMITNDADGVTGGYSANANIYIFGGLWDGNTEVFPSNNCTIMGFGHAANINVRDARLKDTTAWHYIEFNGCYDCIVDNCYFSGGAEQQLTTMEAVQVDAMIGSAQFPWYGPYDDTHCESITVSNCFFSSCGNGVGSHSESAGAHQNIKITNCTFVNCYYSAIYGLGWSGVRVIGNRVQGGYNGIMAVPTTSYSISDWVVEGNTVYALGGAQFYSGGTVGRPISMAYNAGYYVWKSVVSGNTIQSCVGNCNTGIFFNATRQSSCVGNIIDGINGHGLYFSSALYCTMTANMLSNVDSTQTGLAISSCTEVVATNNRTPSSSLYNPTRVIWSNNITGSHSNTGSTTGCIITPNIVNGVVT